MPLYMEPMPLYNEPALMIGKKTVVIADIHIGIEREYRDVGINMPSQTKKLGERIIKLCDEMKIKKLIILGDIKHSIPGTSYQEYREIPALFEKLTAKYDVEIAVGNHDGNISAIIPKNIKIHSSRGFSFQGIGLFHGHAHPSDRVLNAKNLVAAHIHPIVSFDVSFGARISEPCWLKAKLKCNPEKSLIIMPAFNMLCGSAINTHKLKPYAPILKIIELEESDVYLLDGTLLGKVRDLSDKNECI